VVPEGLAVDQKKARRHRAYIALIDETGALLAPLVRRTLALAGRTPELVQRGRHRSKVSVAGALWLSPRRDRLGLFFRALTDAHFNPLRVGTFLDALVGELGGPVVVWDGSTNHRGEVIRAAVGRHRGRLWLERLPAYTPELNPIEQGWCWLKDKKLCNYAPDGVGRCARRWSERSARSKTTRADSTLGSTPPPCQCPKKYFPEHL
jgi:transposase